MNRLWIVAAACSAALAAGTGQAAGNVEAGSAKSAVCQGCHGANGVSINPDWPNLAGIGAGYIVQQVHNFKEGKRQNPVMQPMAMAVSDDDLEDIAAFFNSLPNPVMDSDPANRKAGEKLYRGGSATRGIPACGACHGGNGAGADAAKFPALRGQQAVYVTRQLHDYASGARTTGPGTIMQSIAKRLSDDDIRDISAYVQGMR